MNLLIEKHYRANFSRLVKILTRSFGYHQAEDIVHNTYLKIIQYAKKPEDIDKFFGTILRNCIKDGRRDAIMKGMVDKDLTVHSEIFAEMDSSPEDALIAQADAKYIESIIDAHPPKSRLVLRMFFIEQRSYREIEELVGNISYGNIRKIISSFRRDICSS